MSTADTEAMLTELAALARKIEQLKCEIWRTEREHLDLQQRYCAATAPRELELVP